VVRRSLQTRLVVIKEDTICRANTCHAINRTICSPDVDIHGTRVAIITEKHQGLAAIQNPTRLWHTNERPIEDIGSAGVAVNCIDYTDTHCFYPKVIGCECATIVNGVDTSIGGSAGIYAIQSDRASALSDVNRIIPNASV